MKPDRIIVKYFPQIFNPEIRKIPGAQRSRYSSQPRRPLLPGRPRLAHGPFPVQVSGISTSKRAEFF